jgi:ATP-dependent Zn protease
LISIDHVKAFAQTLLIAVTILCKRRHFILITILSRAADIARSMIKKYGMSNRLGKVYFAHKDQGRILQSNRSSGGEYSETTANMIDKEVRSIIDEQYAVTLHILKQNHKFLRETAETLIEREVIDGDALNHLCAKVRKVTPASGTFASS